jgi:putative transposase
VKGRGNFLQKSWRQEVFKYMMGIIAAKNQKSIIVNGVADHVHVFIGLSPIMKLSDLVREIKSNSSNFINKRNFLAGKFEWQEGYGAFSCSHSQVEKVYNYILNQEEHHKKKNFQEEYLSFLESFQIEYKEKYLFDWLD